MFPNGAAVAAACADGSVHIFDVRANTRVQHLLADRKGSACTGVEFSLSGRELFTAHDNGRIGCWEPFGASAGCKSWLSGHSAAQDPKARVVSCFSLSPDGSALVSAAYDSFIKVWTSA